MHFWKILGDEVKGRSPKKLRSLIDLCGEPESTGSKFQCDPSLISVLCSYTELSISDNFGDEVRGRTQKMPESLIDLCSATERTGSNFQSDPDLFYVVCSRTELSIVGKIWVIR